MNELQKLKSMKRTENGDLAYSTTGNHLVDLLFMTSYFEQHLDEARIGNSDKEKLFAMFIRDPRFGLGRRALGRCLMEQAGVKPYNIVKAGRYDDLFNIPSDENLEYLKMKAKEDNLAKKWLPRLTGKDKQIAKALCRMWGLTEKEYRKLIKTSETTEFKLSYAEKNENNSPLNDLFKKHTYIHPLVSEIDFEQVPSLAMNKYLHCFSTREDIKDRFAEYIQKVKENKAKVNTKVANVHDAYKVATHNSDSNTQEIEEKARDIVASKIVDNATIGVEIDAIPILDTSGSMYDSWNWRNDISNENDIGIKAMSVAYAIATKSTYAPNQVISFSSYPQLIDIKGSTMKEKYESMYTGDCSNTDFGKVMELLRGLKKFPKYLIVLTDMEFDVGSRSSKEETMRMFKEKGANTKIIWWNFNKSNKTSIELDEYGNFYLSGYNLQILNLLENNMDMSQYIDKILSNYAKQIGYEYT